MSEQPTLLVHTASDDALRSLRIDLQEARVPIVEDQRQPDVSSASTVTEKSIDPEVAGLVIAISLPAIRAISRIIAAWIERQGKRRVSLEVAGNRLEIEGATSKGQSAAIEAWIGAIVSDGRHADREG